MPEFKISRRDIDGWAVLELTGDVDLNTAPEARQALVSAISNGNNKVAVNLKQVGFLDSTGLAVLVGGAKRAREAGGDIALVAPNDQIKRILGITDLIKVLPVHDSVEDLIGSA